MAEPDAPNPNGPADPTGPKRPDPAPPSPQLPAHAPVAAELARPSASKSIDPFGEEGDPIDPREAKKKFMLTAGFADQEALLVPPPEPIPTPPRPLPSAPRLTQVTQRKGPTPVAIGVHRFVQDPTSHPAWSEFVQRVLELGLHAWQAQVIFRLVLLALHGRDTATRASSLGRLCAELDAWLTPTTTLMVGPIRLDAPALSPIAGPKLGGVALLAGLAFPEASPEAVASLFAALCGWAAWHAPRVQVYGALDDPPPPLDLVVAMANALARPVQQIPIPTFAISGKASRPIDRMLTSGVLVLELQAAHILARAAPHEAAKRLPALIAGAPIPAARLVLMQAYAGAMRSIHGLPDPVADAPGLLAQIAARFASPLGSVIATALAELAMIARIADPKALGLDLPLRFPTALATAREALANQRVVPRWVVANTQGGDRSLLCATLLGRLPSADPHLLQALVDMAPPELEPALQETVRESWTPSATKAAARATLLSLGRTP